ncbi:MAG: diacylglycerol kinase [Ferruginibacter sp.]|nr:diacylglycerol kinase [Ferruginibacter sp.]
MLFVINPGAGNTNNKSWKESIEQYYQGKDYSIDYFMLPEQPVSADLKRYIDDKKPGRVIAVGGDGTVTMVANIIQGTGIELGILPGGSANGMAKELGIPEEPDEALDITENGEIRKCDTILINNKNSCLHLSDIGLNAQLIKYFDEGKLRGKMGYAKVILKTLWHKEKMQVIIHSKALEVRRHAFMVVLANASKYGTGAVINPEGKIDDGEFEVIIVRRLSVIALVKMLLKPGPFNPKHIEIFPSTSVEITTLKNVHFQIDGEYMGKVNNITAKIIPGNIKLLLPPLKN